MRIIVVLLVGVMAGCQGGRRGDGREGFELVAERRGAAVLVRWVAGGLAGRMRSGELRVQDGRDRTVPLSRDVLEFGSAEVFPRSGDLKVEIRVRLEDASEVSRSVRWIDSPPKRATVALPPIVGEAERAAPPRPAPAVDYRLPRRAVRRIPAP